ncbi:MAG: TRAFs-binding domain-containing protein [Desulfobacterales bacterium]
MNDELKAVRQLCFVDMPFGAKADPKTGTEIDFDQIYDEAIKPSAEESGLECIRGDEERTGGIIHRAMFARLLLCEFVIADLTTANPNVFYELGVRHAAKPYTTIPIFATIGDLPFDVSLVRAIPYDLENGQLTDAGAKKLKSELKSRIKRALEGPVAKDSPLFELFPEFPGIQVSHELTDVFRDRVEYSNEFREKLRAARSQGSTEQALTELKNIEKELGDLKVVESGVLVDLLLSYRDVSAWDEMVALYGRLPPDVRAAVLVRQQYALALNRRAGSGDRDKAVRVLEGLLQKRGPSAETYGILGRLYKDQYKEAKKDKKAMAAGYLDKAIEAYTKGFKCEPVDYYPGVNAITLLLQKGDEDAIAEAEKLTPLVSFAVARRGGASSSDYWDLATVLELAVIGRDEKMAMSVLPKLLISAEASWMVKTTADNLDLIKDLRKEKEDIKVLKEIIVALRNREKDLTGDDS